MAKFKIGDRVKVIRLDNHGDTAIGQTGTVMEESIAPWITFDEPTLYEEPEGFEYPKFPWKTGFMDCLQEEDIELIVGDALMSDETNYEALLRQEDVSHEQVLEELDDAVRAKMISPEVHRVLMAVLEVACE